MKKRRSLFRSLLIGAAVAITVIIFAYGFQVTRVNFKETSSEQRLTQLTRIVRALAKPNLLEYERAEVLVEAPIYLPCPEGGIQPYEPDTSEPYIVLTPSCAGPGEMIQVEGHKFLPQSKGPINFIPPSGAVLTIGSFEVDASGSFVASVELPKRQPVAEAQTIRLIARTNVGLPQISSVALATWEKIVETVFLALLATTFGTLIAIPISFFAARNLMSNIKNPVASVALNILAWPIGIGLGLLAYNGVGQLRDLLISSSALTAGGLVVSPVIIWAITRWALPAEEIQKPSIAIQAARIIAFIVAALSAILTTLLLAHALFEIGQASMPSLGKFSFLGFFTAQFGEIFRMATPLAAALGGGFALGGIASRLGLIIHDKVPGTALRFINLALMALAGAAVFAIIGAGLNWLYQFNNPQDTLLWLAGGGLITGALIAVRYQADDLLPIGSVIYLVVRTILNAVRSIEPLIYVIVFVVWVGIGPFAGALALALHTIAALAKLYSEQVESILPGPLEAVTATGATRLQTIIYAVVPQIIPPYISFTMYRWDINVRMSTIIGFAGGGGIGFLLQQNIRLLDYRAAAVQMLAIAIVVASMDYISAIIRERYV